MSDQDTVIRDLGIWSGSLEIEPLSGGLSNANFKVTDGARRYMVRLGADVPAHHVSRAREQAVSRAAHAAGVSPRLVHAGDGISVFEFLDARTFEPNDMRKERHRVLALLRQCHNAIPKHLRGPAPFFWVFHAIRDYAATMLEDAGRYAGQIPRYLSVADRLERAQVPTATVFGHHDLLCGNIMDDGDRLWIIDWEYGGYGTPLFDLANLAGNNEYSSDEETALLSAYFGQEPDDDLTRAFAAMKAASQLREAMWSMVSEFHLNAPGIDYAAYADETLVLFEQALAEFEAVE
ncbi:MAG: phosphotransferase family protein [Rhodospirillaceae bacterium]|nr:phosphotransferase family protein [Rhodospirillaceae bacterium]